MKRQKARQCFANNKKMKYNEALKGEALQALA
jgi:hypothetical protein